MDMPEQRGQLTPTRTVELLKKLGHSPIKKLGQNFLVDSNIVRKSLDLAEVGPGDSIVEVGPGLGTLTGALLERGAKVYAVELDKTLFKYLARTFGGDDNFDIINADAVERPLADLPHGIENFKIVANLPYAISTPWLERILSGPLPVAMCLMLQKEAAMRFAAREGTGDYSPISVWLGEAYEFPPGWNVSAACFYPRPAVDSVLMLLRRKDNPYLFLPRTKLLMREMFSKRRKQLGAISRFASPENSEILREWLSSEGAPDIRLRPEGVSRGQWRNLDGAIRHCSGFMGQ